MNAIMIMYHKNTEQIERMVHTLSSENFDIFIHADSNLLLSDEDKNKIVAASSISKVYFTEKRHHGVLNTDSLVKIEIELIKTAKACGDYKYFLLLSGQDYPIKPMKYINKKLNDNYPKPFIDCTPYDKHNWVSSKFSYNDKTMKLRKYLLGKRKGPLSTYSLGAIDVILRKLVKYLHIDYYTSLTKQNIELFGGSEWWILPDIGVNYIISEYDSGKSYIKDLLGVRTPDETFFQIMTMRSPSRNLVDVNPKDKVSQSCKTFAYFHCKGKPFVGHPYEFTISDIELLSEKSERDDFWFARKFDLTIDSKVFDLVEEKLLKKFE